MAMSALNRREYGKFKQMLEKALVEIRLPAGIVDTENIRQGCIRPENCNLDAEWDLPGTGGSSSSQQIDSPKVATRNKIVIFLDVSKRQSAYTLPPALNTPNIMFYIKRVDQDLSKTCRIETFEDDKIDNEERIIMSVHEAVILVAAFDKWHILSRYTPPEDVQSLEGSHVSNVNSKVTLLTTD